MRYLVTLLVFLIAGPTIVGSLIIPLTDPAWGFDGQKYILYIVGVGVLIALPVSFLVAGMIMRKVEAATAK